MDAAEIVEREIERTRSHREHFPGVTRRDFEARVVLAIRPMCVLLAVFLLLPGAPASPGDYTVACAFDAGDPGDAG